MNKTQRKHKITKLVNNLEFLEEIDSMCPIDLQLNGSCVETCGDNNCLSCWIRTLTEEKKKRVELEDMKDDK